MAHVEYSWRHSKKADASWFGEELEKITERDGEVSAGAVVDIARPTESPIHNEFEWDDSHAAEQYRKEQARLLIRSLVVVRVDQEKIAAPVRAFVNLQKPIIDDAAEEGDTRSRAYHPIMTVLSDAEMRQQLLTQARNELSAWRKRYADLVEFTKLFPAIDKALRSLDPAA